jgi:hypothetical protein
MALRWTGPLTFAAALFAVAACTGPNTKDIAIVNGQDSNTGSKPQPIRTLSQPEIDQALTGRTFQYTLPAGNGIVSYAAAGKFSFQDDTKGEGTGTWTATEGQICMRFGSATEDCAEFKSTGDAYQIGKSGRLIEMKVE